MKKIQVMYMNPVGNNQLQIKTLRDTGEMDFYIIYADDLETFMQEMNRVGAHGGEMPSYLFSSSMCCI